VAFIAIGPAMQAALEWPYGVRPTRREAAGIGLGLVGVLGLAAGQGFAMDWEGNRRVDGVAKEGVTYHGTSPVLVSAYTEKMHMVRATQCHMLNTWLYVQQTPEFVEHQARRAAHRANRLKGRGQPFPACAKRPKTGKPVRPRAHRVQPKGGIEAGPKCGKWGPAAAGRHTHPRWKTPCKPGKKHLAANSPFTSSTDE
jgi:hypothetical protein